MVRAIFSLLTHLLHKFSSLIHARAIMFHIGIATQHPPLPDRSQMSDIGIDFIEQCVTLDPTERPSAVDLIQHPWLLPMVEAMVSILHLAVAHDVCGARTTCHELTRR